MPRLPTLDASISPDPGNAQRVSVSDAVPQELQQFGESLGTLGQRFIERQKQQQEFDYSVSVDTLRAQKEAALQTAQQNMPATATGFHDQFMASMTPDDAKWLANQPAELQERARAQIQLDNLSISKTAAEAEYVGRGKYETDQIANGATSAQNAVAVTPDPSVTDGQLADIYDKIDNSTAISSIAKVEMKQKIRDSLLATEAQGKYPTPGANAKALGVGYTDQAATASYEAKVGRIEGGNQNDPGGNGGGQFQFTPKTWAQLAKTHPELGLTPGGATDPAQAHRAFAVFTADNAHVLQSAGVTANEANLNLAHFLGAGGATSFVKSMQADPSQSAAALFPAEAADNPTVFYEGSAGHRVARSLSEVYAVRNRGFDGGDAQPIVAAGPGEPRYAGLPLDTRESIFGQVQRTYQVQQTQSAVDFKKQTDAALNDLQNRLQDGNAGQPEINQARQSGLLNDADTVAKFTKIVDDRNKAQGDIQGFVLKSQTPGSVWNQFDPQDQNRAEAGFKALGGDMNAANQVFQSTGIVPKPAAIALRGAIFGQNIPNGSAALQVASNIMAKNPNAFAGADGGTDIAKSAVSYQHFIEQGMSSDQAAQRTLQMNDPNFRPTVAVKDVDLQTYLNSITPDTVASAFNSSYLPFTNPSLGASDEQRNAVLTDFKEVAQGFYKESGDAKLASAQAAAQLAKVYGTTTAFGIKSIAKYPLEKAYPAPSGTPQEEWNDLLLGQAAAVVKAQTGKDVQPSDVSLLPMPHYTAQAFAAGKPVPYRLAYTDRSGPQPQLQIIYGPSMQASFFPNAGAAAAQVSAQRQSSFDAAVRAPQQFIGRVPPHATTPSVPLSDALKTLHARTNKGTAASAEQRGIADEVGTPLPADDFSIAPGAMRFPGGKAN